MPTTDRALDGFSVHECLPWCDLLEYEKTDVIRHILDVLSLGLFQKDSLGLVEREELECSSHEVGTSSINTLVLIGQVGHARREAVVSLVRDLRLRRVRDLVSLVTTGNAVGDGVPHLMMEVLQSSASIRSYRRWYKARCAMQAGLLHKLVERRTHTKKRLRALLRPTGDTHVSSATSRACASIASSDTCDDEERGDTASSSSAHAASAVALPDKEGGGAADGERDPLLSTRKTTRTMGNCVRTFVASSTDDDDFEDLFSNHALFKSDGTLSPPEAAEDVKRKGLSVFEAGARENRVDINAIAATVPTVFIAWSYLHEECIAWLQQHLFNDDAIRELNTINGGVPEKFAVLFDVDPWLRFVQQHTNVPARKKPDAQLQRRKVLPMTSKRAQIVLVNVDRNRAAALSVYEDLTLACGGWRSQEVSMLALWAGEEGLQSPLCSAFGVDRLPFLVVTAPMRRRLRDYRLTRPHIVSTPPPPVPIAGVSGTTSLEDDDTWRQYPAERRQDLCRRLSTKLCRLTSGSAPPLRFCACVEKRHRMLNPHATVASRAIRTDSASHVVMKGLVSDTDLRYFEPELRELVKISDFRFEVDVMRSSGPLRLSLQPSTPTRIVRSIHRAVTCAACAALVDLDMCPCFFCLHCGRQEQGTLCERCAMVHMSSEPRAAFDDSPVQAKTSAAKCSSSPSSRSQMPSRGLQAPNQPPSGGRSPARGSCAAVHPPHHILLRIPHLTEQLLWPDDSNNSGNTIRTIPLLWGESNVQPLPLFCGRLITNLSGEHFGIYCNQCSAVVRGTRWKCALCYQYDLCHRCFEEQLQRKPQGLQGSHHASPLPVRSHPNWHPMLCMPHAVDGDSSRICTPELVKGPLEELLVEFARNKPDGALLESEMACGT